MVGKIELPKKIIIDASLVLALFLPDEKFKSRAVDIFQLYTKGNLDLISVHLLDFEVVNGIKTAVVRQRITEKMAKQLIKNFFNLQIEKEIIDFQIAFDYSLRFSVSVYDASYLVLAEKHGFPLLTADKKFFQKVKKEFKDILLIS